MRNILWTLTGYFPNLTHDSLDFVWFRKNFVKVWRQTKIIPNR